MQLFKILIYIIILSFVLSKTSYASFQDYDTNGYPLYPKINYNSGYPKQLIDKGAYLTKAGNCIACHTNTKDKGSPFAGGLKIVTPFGFFYTPNITPDKINGIGKMTQNQFIQAMHEGVAPNGSNYFPVFPYYCFTKVSNDDLAAIYAYLMSIPPVNSPLHQNNVLWPFSNRFLLWGWKLLFFESHKGIYQYDPKQSATWNRGAYLVQGLGHCTECHTPRNVLGGLKQKHYLSGSFIGNYYVPDISAKGLANSSITDVLNVFIKGQKLNNAGLIKGPMAEVNNDSLKYLSKNDLTAIAIYLKSVNSNVPQITVTININTGKTIYQNRCAICHDSGAAGAPKMGDITAWSPRLKQGINILFQHAINGYNSMPPKGTCFNCTDDDVRAAVEYLVNNSSIKKQSS